MGKPSKYTQKNILDAIKGSGAIMSVIAKRLGCGWHTADTYCRASDDTLRALIDEEETVLDMAESALFSSIQDGDVTSSKWILSTKGKMRGYSERHEITGASGGPVQIVYDKDFDGL